MGKVVMKILQDSAVTQNVRWDNCISFGCKFLIVFLCQKFWKLAYC